MVEESFMKFRRINEVTETADCILVRRMDFEIR
jgi:hypothetical protein